MKKIKLGLFGLMFGAILLGGKVATNVVLADDEEPEVVDVVEEDDGDDTEENIIAVVIDDCLHGTIVTDITTGAVGDVCTINARPDLLYKVDYVSVNGTSLVEDETVKGKYCFLLSEGENKISASFIVDNELCGEFADIVREASDKDWEHLFSLDNVLKLISWLLDGGLLIALIRRYVKDKRLEKKAEEGAAKATAALVPDVAKEAVLNAVEATFKPIVEKMSADGIETKMAIQALAKCFVLSQQDTPESKIAIVDELSSFVNSDNKVVADVKKYINDYFESVKANFDSVMSSLNDISNKNKEIIEKNEEKRTEDKGVNNTYDGTSI